MKEGNKTCQIHSKSTLMIFYLKIKKITMQQKKSYQKSNTSMAALKKELKQNIKDAKSFETIEFALFKNDIYFEKKKP